MSVITVTTTADKDKGSLRQAIESAKSGDTIRFAKGLAGKTIALKSGQLSLDKDLTIDGSGASGLTISGNKSSRVFLLERKNKATLKNLTIKDGKTKGAGGGIDTRHESTLVLENVKVNNNVSELGGGIRVGHLAKAIIIDSSFNGNDSTLTDKYADQSGGAIAHSESRGQLFIKNSSFENNKGFNGGAIFSFSSVSFIVEDSVFKNNIAVNKAGGGAIFTDGVSSRGYSSGLANDRKIIVRDSRFENNKAKGDGGALYLWGYDKDQAIIEDTIFVNNAVTPSSSGKGKGGAIWAKMELNMRNVTVANNTATQQGGGLWLESKLPANIVNSTFSGNNATNDAGGAMFINSRSVPVNIVNSTIAYNKAGRANGGLWFAKDHNVALKNSIVAFNTAKEDHRQDQVGYQPKNNGGNLEFSTSSEAMRVFNKGLFADPRLGSLTSVNGALIHPLKSGSPAVNAGVTQGAPKTDQRGIKRDSRIDIGAFELGVSSLSPAALKTAIVSPSFSPLQSQKLVTYLDLNDSQGKLAKDSSPDDHNNSGSLIADATWTEGIKQGAVAFDGRNDAIKLKSSSAIDLGEQGERTVSLWFKANETNTGKERQMLYEEGGETRGLNMYIDKDKLYVGGWNTPGQESDRSGTWLSTDKISDDKWHQVDLVLEGGSKITQDAFPGYLDGEKFGSGAGSQLWSHSGGIGMGSINGGTRFHDGITANSGSSFTGSIDEVMIFNHALSSNEIGMGYS